MQENNSPMIAEDLACETAAPIEETACSQPQQPESNGTTGSRVIFWVQRVLVWIISAAFFLVGIAAGFLVIHICKEYPTAKPILLSPPEAAIRQVTDMMDAVCDGDYAKASTYLLGSPSLGVAEPAGNPLSLLLWDAFLDSTEFSLVGECYTTEVGLAQSISFTYLDPASVTVHLRERSQKLLSQRVEEAEDVSEIYDENNEYKESVVMEVLKDATQEALREDAKLVTVTLTVNLKYQDGTWWIVADDALLDAFSGGILH